MSILQDTDLLKIDYTKKDKEKFSGKFTLEPLSPGFGLTIGHALRRVLLSSLPGAAINTVKIEGATHEFSTIPGVKEDVVDLILNLKSIRLKLDDEENAVIKLEKKGPGIVTAGDFQKNSSVTIIDKDHYIATLGKNAKLSIEATVKKGRGYEPIEKRKDEKMPLGTIAVDSIYTPVKKINYDVENTRVGGMTNYDKVILDITTDGTITPEEAFKTANQILLEHFNLIDEKVKTEKKESKNQKQLNLDEVVEETPKSDKKADKKVEKTSKKKTVKKAK